MLAAVLYPLHLVLGRRQSGGSMVRPQACLDKLWPQCSPVHALYKVSHLLRPPQSPGTHLLFPCYGERGHLPQWDSVQKLPQQKTPQVCLFPVVFPSVTHLSFTDPSL